MPIESIRDVARALRTVDPAERDDSDLAVLREVVGDARVVCLGESAHVVSEFYRLRDRVLRFLVRELGFSAFVLESGLPEGLAVDDWVRGGPGDRSGLSRGIAELIVRAAAAGDDVALRCARGAQRVVEFLSHGLYPGPGRNLRNEVMAENLRWILDREHRILVGAHNVHVQRSPSFDGTAPIGALLAPVLGDDLVVIGTTRAAGTVPEQPDLDAGPDPCFVTPAGRCLPLPAHCLDAILDAVGLPLHLVDLRRTPPAILAGATAMSAQTVLIDLDPRQAFDAVIHVRNITSVREARRDKALNCTNGQVSGPGSE